jgi:RNA polymerase sigma factor (sigma-70 family)
MNSHTVKLMPDMALQVERFFTVALYYSNLSEKLFNIPVNPVSFINAGVSALESSDKAEHRETIVNSFHSYFVKLILEKLNEYSKIFDKYDFFTNPPDHRSHEDYFMLLEFLKTSGFKTDANELKTQPGTLENNSLLALVSTLEIDVEYILSQAYAKWDFTQRTKNLEDTIAYWSLKGFDGLKVTWGVISLECHNHINLVWHQANKMEKAYPSRESSELLSFGFMGLRTALKLYDPDKGFAFSTYACTRITGAIKDGVRAESPVPKRLNTFNRKVSALKAELEYKLNRTPTLEEISENLGADLDKLKILTRLAPEASVDEIIENSQMVGSTPSWLIDHASDPSILVENADLADMIDKALSELPFDEAQAIRLMVMEQLSPSKIREITGVSSRLMRARRDKGLVSLKKVLQPMLAESM